jgi:hypothetical protein
MDIGLDIIQTFFRNVNINLKLIKKKSNQLRKDWKTFSISEMSYFNPWVNDNP